MFEILDGRSEFYQWDSDRQIIVKDESITQLHFCNRTDDCSLCVSVENGIANVPNVLLQDSWNIKVYGFDKNYTKHCETFKVVGRSKPSDYIYTETEVKNYEDLKNRVDEIEKNGISDERIGTALESYLEENPIEVEVDLSDYATTEYVDEAVENIQIPDAGEGCHIGMKGTAKGAEVFNDYASNEATGEYAVAQGNDTKATGANSHAEGGATVASGNGAHAEGIITEASGYCAHSEGNETIASGANSHAEGFGTIAAGAYQHVEGIYNIPDSSNDFLHIVGNGMTEDSRSNAYTLDRFGNGRFGADVYAWGEEKLATEAYVNEVASGGGTGGGLTEAEVNNLINTALNKIGIAEDGEY